MKEEEGGVISTSLWAQGWRQEGEEEEEGKRWREADSQAEERGRCCRVPSAWQAGRQGGESAGKEQRDGLVSYRKLLPRGEGLDAPVVEPSGSREPCVKLEIKHKMHFHPPTEKSFNLHSLFISLYHHLFDKAAAKPEASTLIFSAATRLTSCVSSSVVS